MSDAREADPGEGGRDFAAGARRFVTHMSQLVRVTALHDVENQAVLPVLAAVLESAQGIAGAGGFSLLVKEDGIFANGRALRFTPAHFASMRDFIEILARKGIAKVSFPVPPDGPSFKAFLQAIHAAPKGDPEVVLRAIRSSLPAAVAETIQLLSPKEAEHESARVRVQVDPRRVPILLYTKLHVLLGACQAGMRSGGWPAREMGRLQRGVQDFVGFALKEPDRVLFVLGRTRGGDYDREHAVHVGALSVLAGARLGLDRLRLSDLALAALLHNLGRGFLPSEVLSHPGALTEEDRKAIANHPALAVRAILKAPRATEAVITRAVVAFEHNRDANGYPWLPGDRKLHLYSRIVAVCDAWDAMVTDRPWRPAMAPPDALAALEQGAGTRYDPAVVKAVVQTVRPWPPGFGVRLSTGERAVVLRANPDPALWDRPWVLVEADAAGSPSDGPVVDLSAAPDRRIAGPA